MASLTHEEDQSEILRGNASLALGLASFLAECCARLVPHPGIVAMHIDPAVAFAGVIGVAVWLFMRWRSPRPEFPPLSTSPDDPLMKDALEKARSSLGQFMNLIQISKDGALIKLQFVSNSNQVEHLWAEVLEIIDANELGVRLVTPPVTHSGQLDRLYRCTLEDIEDWQVRDRDGKMYGGFSQRAMFAIARRDGIKLPKSLLANEHEYRDA